MIGPPVNTISAGSVVTLVVGASPLVVVVRMGSVSGVVVIGSEVNDGPVVTDVAVHAPTRRTKVELTTRDRIEPGYPHRLKLP
jgi:hypothetical protein